MLKFAYQGPNESAMTDHDHSAGLHDRNHCCEVCEVRKVEMSREKSRVNRARSRSRERVRECGGKSTCSDQLSTSRDCTSDDNYSVDSTKTNADCYRIGREVQYSSIRHDTRCNSEQKGFNPFRRLRRSRSKERLLNVKGNHHNAKFQERRQSYNQSLAQLTFGNEDCQNVSSPERKRLYEPKLNRNRSQSDYYSNNKMKRNRANNESEDRRTVCAGYYDLSPNNQSPIALYDSEHESYCESQRVRFESKYQDLRQNEYRRRKSGSEIALAEEMYRRTLSDNRHLSVSCERLFLANQDLRHSLSLRQNTRPSNDLEKRRKHDEGRNITQNNSKREWTGFFRKKVKRSKSQEKLTFVGNMISSLDESGEYSFDDDDWETKSMTIGRMPSVRRREQNSDVNQTRAKKQWRRSRSCERLTINLCESELDNIREMEHKARRRSLERRIREKHSGSASTKTPLSLNLRPTIKQASVRKTSLSSCKTSSVSVNEMRNQNTMFYSQTDEECIIPCERSYQSSTDTSEESDTLPEPPYSYRNSNSAIGLKPSSYACTPDPEGQEYSQALRQVACANREQLFKRQVRTGQKLSGKDNHSPLPAKTMCNTAPGQSRRPTEIHDVQSNLTKPKTTDSSTNHVVSMSNGNTLENLSQKLKYTSLSSISTTLSTTSEDSLDSGQGSSVDFHNENLQMLKIKGNRYSPIEAERICDDQRNVALGLSKHCEKSPTPTDTSDYDSESGLNEIMLHAQISYECSLKVAEKKIINPIDTLDNSATSISSKRNVVESNEHFTNVQTNQQRRVIRFVDF